MYVLVKYRHASSGTVGWFQMDKKDARRLFKKLSGVGLYWFCVVDLYDVWYFNAARGWSRGVRLLKYC